MDLGYCWIGVLDSVGYESGAGEWSEIAREILIESEDAG